MSVGWVFLSLWAGSQAVTIDTSRTIH